MKLYTELTNTAQTAYAQLVDAALSAEHLRSVGRTSLWLLCGKTVKGHKYWYYQYTEPSGKLRQIFVGPDNGVSALIERKAHLRPLKRLNRLRVPRSPWLRPRAAAPFQGRAPSGGVWIFPGRRCVDWHARLPGIRQHVRGALGRRFAYCKTSTSPMRARACPLPCPRISRYKRMTPSNHCKWGSCPSPAYPPRWAAHISFRKNPDSGWTF